MLFGFAWAWLALAGRKAIPWLFTSFRDFEPPEHVPRTLARAHICSQCSRGPPACPVIDSKRKNPRAEEQKMPMSKKSSYYTSQYALVFLVTTVSTAVQQVSGTGTRLPGTWYQPGTRLPIYLLPTAVPGTGILVRTFIKQKAGLGWWCALLVGYWFVWFEYEAGYIRTSIEYQLQQYCCARYLLCSI